MPSVRVLQEELQVYERHKAEWLKSHKGEYVVVVGQNLIGFHADYESAFKAGLTAAGLGNNFLLKQVCAEDPVYLIY